MPPKKSRRSSPPGLPRVRAETDTAGATGGAARLARAALVVLAVALAVGAVAQQRRLSNEKTRLAEVLARHEVDRRRPDVLAELRRESDPAQARLVVASSLLADVLDPASTRETQAATLEHRITSSQVAAELASEALDLSPLSWRARLLLGASIYLSRSLARDSRLVSQYKDWEIPLQQAREMAPTEPEPQRFLSLAYLEIWPMLSPEKQDLTRDMLKVAFEDRSTFDSHIEAWLAVARDDEDALQVLPEQPHVWETLRNRFIKAGRWQSAAAAQRRLLQALDRSNEVFLTDALARLHGGDFRNGRDRLLVLAVTLEPERRWLSFFTKTMERLPPGPVKLEVAARLSRWLDWNLERCLFERCLLSQRVQERLIQLVDPDEPLVRARALLAANNLAEAQRAEPTDADHLEGWSPYWLQKASFLIERGSPAGAARSLAKVTDSWRDSPLFAHRVEQLVAENPSLGGARSLGYPAAQATSGGAAALRRTEWPATAWRDRQLLLWPAEASSGLDLDFGQPAAGDVVEVLWNGGAIGVFVVEPASPHVRVMVEVETNPQLLELRSLKGASPPKPEVRLLEPNGVSG